MQKAVSKRLVALFVVLGMTINMFSGVSNIYASEQLDSEKTEMSHEYEENDEEDADQQETSNVDDEDSEEEASEETDEDSEEEASEETEGEELEAEIDAQERLEIFDTFIFSDVEYVDTSERLYDIIDALEEGDSIEIVVENDLYFDKALVISKSNVNIYFSATEEVQIISGGAQVHLKIENADNVEIIFNKNIVLDGKKNKGGIEVNSSEVLIEGVRVTGMYWKNDNGGAFKIDESTVTLNNVELYGNNPSENGGGIYALNSELTLNEANIYDNHGNGIYAEGTGSVTVNGGSIRKNLGNNFKGGGIYAEGTLTVNGGLIEQNRGGLGAGIYSVSNVIIENEACICNNYSDVGGGIYAIGALTVNGGIIIDNDAFYWGGGIYAEGVGEVIIKNARIEGNTARYFGGALYYYVSDPDFYEHDRDAASQLIIEDSLISNNHTKNDTLTYSNGGGMYIGTYDIPETLEVTIRGSQINHNSSYGPGAGLYIFSQKTLVIEGSEFNGNTSSGGGAAIAFGDGNISSDGGGKADKSYISNTDFIGNVAEGSGGAIMRYGNLRNEIDITGGSFVNNHSKEAGGAIDSRDEIYVDGTEFEGNTADGAVYWDVRNPSAEWQAVYSDFITNVDSASASPEDGYGEFNNIWNNYDIGVDLGAAGELTGIVSFHPMGGIWAQGSEDSKEVIQYLNEKVNLSESISREDYALDGWYYYDYQDQMRKFDLEDQVVVALPLDLYARWIRVTPVTVIFDSNGGSAVESQVIEVGEYVVCPEDPKKEGYVFAGWYQDEELTEIWNFNENTVEDELVLYAVWTAEEGNSGGNNGGDNNSGGNNGGDNNSGGNNSGGNNGGDNNSGGNNGGDNNGGGNNGGADRENKAGYKAEAVPVFANDEYPILTDEHKWYVTGYPDETFRAEAYITRAEVAMIFFNLIEAEDKDAGYKAPHSDIAEDVWYTDAVGYITQYDIMQGYPDGTFRPDAYITRAELAIVCSMFFDMQEGTHSFTDVSDDHWAVKYIINAHVNGWIQGYPDGTFRADYNITRAETVTMLNSILGRRIHADAIPVSVSVGGFTDLDQSHWAYADIMEAAHTHEYSKDEEGFEEWLDFDKGESEL